MYSGVPTTTPRSVIDSDTDPEIGEHRVPVREEDVLRLHIPVDEPLPVRVVERRAHVAHDAHRFHQRNAAVLLQPGAQRSPMHVLRHVVQQPVRLSRIEEGQDVRMRELRRDLDLAHEARRAEGRGALWPQPLHRRLAMVLEIVREIGRGHAAAADLLVDRAAPREGCLQPLLLLIHFAERTHMAPVFPALPDAERAVEFVGQYRE
jgi:hypothetical protein